MSGLSAAFSQQFIQGCERLPENSFQSSIPAHVGWDKLKSDKEFKRLHQKVLDQLSSSSSSSTSSSSSSPSRQRREDPHQLLLAHALAFIHLGDTCQLVARDTHQSNAPVKPYHRIDVCLVDKNSLSSRDHVKVLWNDIVCAVEIKQLIDDVCVRQLCDSSSELFSSKCQQRDFAYGLAMSTSELQIFKFSLSSDGQPTLSNTPPMLLFPQELPSEPTTGFMFLVKFFAQSFDSLGFRPFGASEQFVSFFQRHQHFQNRFSISSIGDSERAARKPLLFSIAMTMSSSSFSSSSSSSSSAAFSSGASVQNLISTDSVPMENLSLDSVCIV